MSKPRRNVFCQNISICTFRLVVAMPSSSSVSFFLINSLVNSGCLLPLLVNLSNNWKTKALTRMSVVDVAEISRDQTEFHGSLQNRALVISEAPRSWIINLTCSLESFSTNQIPTTHPFPANMSAISPQKMDPTIMRTHHNQHNPTIITITTIIRTHHNQLPISHSLCLPELGRACTVG